MGDAVAKHSSADVLVNFASLRSAYESTVEAMSFPQVLLSFCNCLSLLPKHFVLISVIF